MAPRGDGGGCVRAHPVHPPPWGPGGDHLLLNCTIMPSARATLPDNYSEHGYTKATSDTCVDLLGKHLSAIL